jgi:hypothetical protein
LEGDLLHSPAEIVQQLLIDAGIGTDPDFDLPWPVYSTNEPDAPDNCITVTDTTGESVGRTQWDGRDEMHWGVQIRIRAVSHENVGWRKGFAIRTFISQEVSQQWVTLEGTDYLINSFAKIGSVLALGKDVTNTKRSLFTINPTVVITRLN